ncbi:efflux RND transporter periplasmic adaptor subunit [Salinarimonas soli]|uniref:HlyD family efflux transporter periplasmic adaptor subunit n=1 Tax=Salinarimonas soli TaxID=1638099 RepID=A0A5B2VBY0_9HYPH|nr:HlyD family efflux transporter periplasmic adaptor subunit [Salinarimonas soli]KAA2235647.1 HlyD family efflux transporter periplasmic adaptor subunit [Salinarimonas soli]
MSLPSVRHWLRRRAAPLAIPLLAVLDPLTMGLAAQPGPAGQAVTVARVAEECLADRVPFIGMLVAREDALVLPPIEGGRVTEVLVEEGARVTAGQVLARLAPPGPAGSGGEPIDVTAPVDGLVLARGARIGVIASASSPDPLFRLARDGAMDVATGLAVARLANVQPGQVARLQTPGGLIAGRVRHVAPEIDRQSRLSLVRIAFEADPRLRFGASVAGTIEIGAGCGPVVPISALVAEGERTMVQRVRDGRVETVTVRPGLVEGGRVQIREGLAAGDLVVSRASAFVRDGDLVRTILPETAR